MEWRVYYADGSTFSSVDGNPHDAPFFGIIAVCQPCPDVGLETLHAFDWYFYMLGRWNGAVGHDALIDHVTAYAPDLEAVVVGRQVPRAQYQEIMRKALHDPDFPRKSGKHAGERPR